jgi:transcriptional regulator with XRE-family HTH domain
MPDRSDPLDVAVGARISARRLQLGRSQTKLADALGITFQQVQKYERGDNRVAASTLVRAAAALQVSVASLVGEDGGPATDGRVAAKLAKRGAFDLLDAYAGIADADVRGALRQLAKTVAASARRSAAA